MPSGRLAQSGARRPFFYLAGAAKPSAQSAAKPPAVAPLLQDVMGAVAVGLVVGRLAAAEVEGARVVRDEPHRFE